MKLTITLLLLFKYVSFNKFIYSTANLSSAEKCISKFGCFLRETLVSCAYLNLTKTPNCLEEDNTIETFDLQGNFYLSLKNSDFPTTYFSTTTLILKNSSIKLLNANTFVNFPNLSILDLSINHLKVIHPQLFEHNLQLQLLNLSLNIFTKIVAHQFISGSLQHLDLSYNFLNFIDESAFVGLPGLMWLNLRNNKLRSISYWKASILLLGGNLWNCDCDFYLKSKIASDEENLTCVDSEQNRMRWNETPLLDDDCTDKSIIFESGVSKNDKAARNENSPDLILDVYGFVLIGLTLLIFLCCCCEGHSKRQLSRSRVNSYANNFNCTLQPFVKEADTLV